MHLGGHLGRHLGRMLGDGVAVVRPVVAPQPKRVQIVDDAVAVVLGPAPGVTLTGEEIGVTISEVAGG